MNRIEIVVALAAALVTSVASAQGAAPVGDPAKGREKVQMCQGCHGIDGWRTAFPEVYSVPKIAGQNAAYLILALKEYRDGNRTHPSMRAIAAGLTDQDMANLAAYYAQYALTTQVK